MTPGNYDHRKARIAATLAFPLLAVTMAWLLQRSPHPNLLLGLSNEFWAGVCLGLSLVGSVLVVAMTLPRLASNTR